MSELESAWMPRERWDALVRGENCPLCRECSLVEPLHDEGYTIADLPASRLRLAKNQWVRGYCVLVCKWHACEPHELGPERSALYFADLTHAARAIERCFAPIKLNYQILGNVVPHLHAHLIPRYFGDPAPGRAIDVNAETRLLEPREYEDLARAIRAGLE